MDPGLQGRHGTEVSGTGDITSKFHTAHLSPGTDDFEVMAPVPIIRVTMNKQRRRLHATGIFLIGLLALNLDIFAAQAPGRRSANRKSPAASFVASPAIAALMAQVQPAELYDDIARLTGELPAVVDGVPYTISSRNTLWSGSGIQMATQFAYERFQSLGLSAGYHYWSGCGKNSDISSRNVIGEKVGVTLPGEIVVIMAHLDSMPAEPLSFGADDDATGSAGVLAAAGFLGGRSFERTVRFVLTTGEEQGLCGGRAYAALAGSREENIVAVYNLDMIGWDSDNYPTLRLHIRRPDRPGYEDDLPIADTFSNTVSAYGLNLIPIISADYYYNLRNADQVPFWDYGYPGLLAIEDTQDDFNTNYHTQNDRLGTLNFPYLVDFVKASLGAVAHLAGLLNSSVEIMLSEGGASTSVTAGSPGRVLTGYADAAVVSGEAPYGVAVFSFEQNGVIVSEAAVPPSPPTISSRVFVDYRSAVAADPSSGFSGSSEINTGVAVVNPGSTASNVTFSLRDSVGAILATGHGKLAGGAHFAKFMHQLSDVAPDFAVPDDFPTATHFGTLDITSDEPVSVLALRLTVNQRNETLLTSTPTADLTRPAENYSLYFPHLVDGGGYTTTVVLLNTSSADQTGRLNLYGPSGAPLVVNQIGGTRDSTFAYSIPPAGVFVFRTDGFPTAPNSGSAQLIPDSATSSPVGAAVISYSQGNIQVTESGVPAATPTTHARIYVDQSENHGTGVAIANPGTAEISVALQTFLADGTTPAGAGPASVSLGGYGHVAAFVPQLVSGLPPDFRGVLDISSPLPFVALTLRSLNNSRGDFLLTTFPIADTTRPAPAPLIFPQIAGGGGYLTEFILLSAGKSANTVVSFHGEDGSALAIAK